MTTNSPYAAPSPASQPATFTVGSLVRIQHNTKSFRIVCPAAWADAERSLPTHYNVKATNGQLHIMVPVERLTTCWVNPRRVLFGNRDADTNAANTVSYVKHTHCWSCKTTLNHLVSKVCPTCRGLLCKCGGCRCNWPYDSYSTPPGNFDRCPVF
jgi:hypothetical protein